MRKNKTYNEFERYLKNNRLNILYVELDFITQVDILKIIVKEQKVFLKKLKTIPQKTINKEIINNENINIYEVEALFEGKLKKIYNQVKSKIKILYI